MKGQEDMQKIRGVRNLGTEKSALRISIDKKRKTSVTDSYDDYQMLLK